VFAIAAPTARPISPVPPSTNARFVTVQSVTSPVRPNSGRVISGHSAASQPAVAGDRQSLRLSCMDQLQTRYAKSGNVSIAYQVVGEGPFDLIWVPGWISNVEESWEVPEYARFLRRLASFSRLLLFDKRGTGLSDSVPNDRLPTLEQRMDDMRAVLEAAGSERAAVFGASEGGNMSVLFTATYPQRVRALVLAGVYAMRG